MLCAMDAEKSKGCFSSLSDIAWLHWSLATFDSVFDIVFLS